MNYITTDDGDSRLSLAQWQPMGHDGHSQTGAVATLFADATSGNYLLGTNSPAVDAAQPLPGASSDLDGLSRPFGSAPDIGCYEQWPLALQLTQVNVGSCSLKLLGGAGKSYRIDVSERLTNWTPLASLVRSNVALELVIQNDGTYHFYRAVWIQ